jgi:exosortase/archaeosortase family protein
LKNPYPKPSTLFIVFLSSFALFYTLPPIILSVPAIAIFFKTLGGFNAEFHAEILGAFGIDARAASNLLYISSGPVVEYSPYCFGLISISALMILILLVPTPSRRVKLKWIVGASSLLISANQGRILFELMLASYWPDKISSIDVLLYPLLPALALGIWYKGLKSFESPVRNRGGGVCARG